MNQDSYEESDNQDYYEESENSPTPMPIGTLRKGDPLGGTVYVECYESTMYGIDQYGPPDWINTGELPKVVTSRNPTSGYKTFDGDNGNVSKVEAVLKVDLGWGDRYQEATMAYATESLYWESVAWKREPAGLTDDAKPVIDLTVTLTGPEGVIRSDELRVGPNASAYLLIATLPPYQNLAVGTHRVEVTGVKTGGRFIRESTSSGLVPMGRDRVELKALSVSFTIGRPDAR